MATRLRLPLSPSTQRLLLIAATTLLLTSVLLYTTRFASHPLLHRTSSSKPPPVPMSYGNYARPAFADLPPLVSSLDASLVPTPLNNRRLIIIGDIHGMRTALDALLDRVAYHPPTDHVVAVGDVVYRGPDSAAVVDRLMALNASVVRGNHEDRLLLALDAARHRHGVGAYLASSPRADMSRGEAAHLAVARSLTSAQLDWLAHLPLILDAYPLPIYIVHAGLVPGIALERQDPWAVMNMRSLVYPAVYQDNKMKRHGDLEPGSESHQSANHLVALPVDNHSGKKWTKAWNRWQEKLPESQRRTVVYGHDAKRGLSHGSYTFGLDSGCVRGNSLTALVVEATANGGFKHAVHSVPCQKPRATSA